MHLNTSVRFLVADPSAVAGFLAEVLDFEVAERGESWWANNGAISIVLEPGDSPPPVLCLQTNDLEGDCKELLSRQDIQQAPASSPNGPANVPERPARLLKCACGLQLILFQERNEDEQNLLVELPASLPWDPAADLLTRELLRLVPVWVRNSARKRVTGHAEYLAVESGTLEVAYDLALRAFVDCTLPSQLEALFAELTSRGIDTQPFEKNGTC